MVGQHDLAVCILQPHAQGGVVPVDRRCEQRISMQVGIYLLETKDCNGFSPVHLGFESTFDPLFCGSFATEHPTSHETSASDRCGNGTNSDNYRGSHEGRMGYAEVVKLERWWKASTKLTAATREAATTGVSEYESGNVRTVEVAFDRPSTISLFTSLSHFVG